jgi:hypothetical protein
MRKVITIVLFLLTYFLGFGQNDLKIEMKVDAFNGDTMFFTSWIALHPAIRSYGKTMMKFAALRNKERKSKILHIRVLTSSLTSVLKDSELLIKTTEGHVIKLTALDDYTGSLESAGTYSLGLRTYSIESTYLIDDINMERLALKRIEAVRLTTTDGNLDATPQNDKFTDNFRLGVNKFYTFMKYKK